MAQIRSLILTVALAIGLIFGASAAIAADRVELNDGRTFEGTIVREVEGYIWIKATLGGIEREMMFTPAEIKSVDRDAATATADKDDAKTASTKKESSPKPRVSGAPRAAIITLGEGGDKDMVGLYMTADSLERVIPMLEQEKVDVVVLLVNSGGGAILEIKKISDVIEYKLKPRFRVVAWIDSAISAAAMISHTVEEIYFMPHANYGASTAFSGALQAVKDRELEEILFLMEQISDRGKHDRAIMRSMQIMEPLSVTIDDHGDVHWSNSLDGQHIVNPKGRVLTMTARDAVEYRFARGIARDHHELAKQMGYQEIEWVGRQIRGVPYPVCRAEENVRTFRDTTHRDVRRTQLHFVVYQEAMNMAQGLPREERGPFLGRASQALDRIEAMLRNNPNAALFGIGALQEQIRDWVEEQRDAIRRLRQR